jgi:glycosyltransferase involved in cell wall biosynthesis
VIIAAFNAEATLGRAIDSVFSQQFADWKTVVVDDGSTDGTLAVAERYARCDSRITVLSQANAGAGAARNAALALVDSEYVTYLDSDDALANSHMTTMLKLTEDYPDHDIYSCDGLFVYPDGSENRVFEYDQVVSLRIEDMLSRCMILGGGALLRASLLRSLGGFREHMYGEDYDLWLRALATGARHIATPEPLYVYHQGVGGQKSEDTIAGYRSAVVAVGDLLTSGLLTAEQERMARAGMEQFESSLQEHAVNLAMERQAERLRSHVERVFGSRMSGRVMAAIHRVSWIVRPFRRARLSTRSW